MAERITHLSIANLFDGDHNHLDIPKFITDFSGSLYSGDGKKPAMLERLGIGPDFPVRLLVGIPQKSLTREQRLIAEAYCSMVFGRMPGDTKGLWQYGKGWQPKNPTRRPGSLKDCQLDIDFMLSLGINKSIWCNDILLAPAAIEAAKTARPSTMMRHLFALVAYGFSDPYVFFTLPNDQQSEKQSPL